MRASVSIKNNYEFRRLYAKGRSAVSPTLVVYMRKTKRSTNRVGFTVTTKLGKAVVRNKIRRRLREIYRLNEYRLSAGLDMVVVARGRSVNAPYRTLEKDFLSCCGKLGLFAETDKT